MHKPWSRVLRDGESAPSDWNQCECPTRAGRPCPIEADRVWEGANVCHVHDPDGKMCSGNPSARSFAISELAKKRGGV